MKILCTSVMENSAGGAVDGVIYFGAAYKVPATVWQSGGYQAWIMETYPPQSYAKIPDMEPVPGANVELVETYTPDGSGDLWVVWRVPYRRAGTTAGRASR